jgi:hypothetical protein
MLVLSQFNGQMPHSRAALKVGDVFEADLSEVRVAVSGGGLETRPPPSFTVDSRSRFQSD